VTTATGIATSRVPTPHGEHRSGNLDDAISVPRRVGHAPMRGSNDI